MKALPDNSVYALDTDHVVTLRQDKIFTFGDMALPAHYNRIVKLADGRFAALAGYGQGHEAEYPLILVGETFVESKGLGKIVDFAADIKLAPQDYWWINHNGRTEKGQKKNPGLVPVWDDPLTCKFADVSRRGWTLATQEDGQNVSAMLGAPLIPVTGGAAIGVDNLSATTQSSSWDKPAETVGNKDEFWAMVPAGGTIQFTLKSPATSLTPLLIDTSGTIGATPATITVPQTSLTLSAPASAAGTEHVIPFKLAGIASSTVPLKAKVMKPRVVSLSVWPLQRPAPHAGTMPAIPDKAEFEAYLNGIYKPQLNVTFDVTINPTSTISPDPGVSFTVADPPNPAQVNIAATRTGGDIRLFILGSYNDMSASGPFGYGGWANPGNGNDYIWASVGDLKGPKPENEKKELWLNTVAHEIGHVFVGAGHPDDSSKPGPAGLPGTNRKIRLMFSGFASNAPPANRRWLVKGEWDAAEPNLKRILNEP